MDPKRTYICITHKGPNLLLHHHFVLEVYLNGHLTLHVRKQPDSESSYQ